MMTATMFLLGRKAMTNLDSVLKSRDMTLPTEVRLVKGMVFPVKKRRSQEISPPIPDWNYPYKKHRVESTERDDFMLLAWALCG